MSTTRTIAALFVAVLGACLFAAPAAADDFTTVYLDQHIAVAPTRRLRARVLATPAGSRHGGYGYVSVELHNPGEQARTVHMSIVPNWYYGPGVGAASRRLSRTHRLEPGESSTLHLPLVNSRYGSQMLFSVPGVRGPFDSPQFQGPNRHGTGDAGVLTVWRTDVARDAKWNAYFKAITPSAVSSGSTVAHVSRAPAQLPDRWSLLSGFDLVVVDMRAGGLTAEAERVLERYVAGGGNLAILGMSDTAEGPLHGLLEELTFDAREEDSLSGFHGLGRWIAVAPHVKKETEALRAWLLARGTGEYGILASAGRSYAGGVPTPFWLPLEIPGLGEVPVKAFFFLLLLFAIVVGPLNYIYFRRRKRLPMLLITIPAMGFVCTVVILLYGFFSEGFGIIGSTRSFSVLDQRDHTASVCTGATLFAGLQPSALTPAPDSFFCSSSFQLEGYGRDASNRFVVDLDGGYRVEGSALPSRTPTPVAMVSVGRARARLRFRRRPDGGFDVLAAPDFTPLEETAAMLLRTRDGALYLMDAHGALAPCGIAVGDQGVLIRQLLDPLNTMQVSGGETQDDDLDYSHRSGSGYRRRDAMQRHNVGTEGLDKWFALRLRSLPRGSYLARMKQAPVQADLGLDVEYRAARHVVLGLLAEEDVIDE